MEAPEKIYLCPSDLPGIDYEEEWSEFPWGDNNIEYIRKDAFIEKACEWLEKHTFSELNLDFGYSLQIKEFVDLFKEYMKGK